MKNLILVVFVLFGGECWADAVTDRVVEVYQAEITKAGALFDAQVLASTVKATKQLELLSAKAKDEAKTEIELVTARVQTGALAPVFIDPRRYDLQPPPWTPLTALSLSLDGTVQINAKDGIVEVNANRETVEIGYFKAGTLVSVKCVGGVFRTVRGDKPLGVTDPDAPAAVEILSGDAAANKWSFRLPLPGGTVVKPFVLKVEKTGTYYLRSAPRSYGANTGLGAFEIKLGGG